jgi:dipeptidase E
MKLLLTSAGVTNQSIADSLVKLVGKPINDIKIGFIPTAVDVWYGTIYWYLEQFSNLYKYGFKSVFIVDPSANGVDYKLALKDVDVILVGGGNTFHLLNQVRLTGFGEWLKTVLDNKVYMGISAGSILATPSIAIASVDNGDENLCGITDLGGLSLVDFEVSPHTPEDVSMKGNEEYAKTIKNVLYTLDDNSAIEVNGKEIKVISEGEWHKLNS